MSHKALFLSAPKGAFTVQDRPTPTPGANQILVRTRAVALNPAEYKEYDTGLFLKKWPMVLGRDVAGSVVSIGSDVDKFKPGDSVLSFSIFSLENDPDQGTFQEYVLCYSHLTSRIPKGFLFESAASLPTGLGTAAGLLRRVGLDVTKIANKTEKSDVVLIWGGSSSVGTSAIQFASAAGAVVFTTASPQHHEYLRQLGADAVFDYKSSEIADDIVEEASDRGLVITKFVDAVSANLAITAAVVSKLGGGTLATVLPWEMMNKVPPPDNVTPEMSGLRDALVEKDYCSHVFNDLVPDRLRDGYIRPAKTVLVPGGLSGIEAGLNTLRNGVSGVKLVASIKGR
ncbi:chaperonin 10-like protein [Thelonectria olida]|uniref:Chaperonin 10-like protein n=1 Tax=Thelonectria olida TaxID=1576542 RepID=A0A9P8W5A3_9HYPO|nr:chaperonin 10-like protein [Thelonectria olida]